MTTPKTPDEIPPQYDAAATEKALYAEWEAAGVFRASAERSDRNGGDRAPYTIVIPPPNVTGVLHMGHGLNNTAQDVLIRWRRMSGDEALWVPGTDHAGIATQNIVEKQLAKEGRTRDDLGREDFGRAQGGALPCSGAAAVTRQRLDADCFAKRKELPAR